MKVTSKDLTRFSRQIILKQIGIIGQKKIFSAKVLVVGAGGLGCPLLLYLANTGVGRIGIVDHDKIELSNLNRQILFNYKDIGKYKVDLTKKRIKEINKKINIKTYKIKIDKKNVDKIFKEYDIICDGTDNFETRYIINEKCHLESKILISGSATQFEGQVSVFKSGNDKKLPCYECLFPRHSTNLPNFNCREAGIIGPVTNLIASIQVTEGIRESLINLEHSRNNMFFNHSNAGYLLLYEASTHEINRIKIKKDTSCKICK